MTTKGYLPFLPILLGSFFISLFQNEHVAWTILAFSFHFFATFLWCITNRYIEWTSVEIPKWMHSYRSVTTFLPFSILAGLGVSIHFFVEEINVSNLINLIINESTISINTIGLLLGFLFGTITAYKMKIRTIKKFLFVKKVNYHIHDLILEEDHEKMIAS